MNRRGGRNLRQLAGGAAIGSLAAATGLAQGDPPGGIDLVFSVNENVFVSDNAGLDPDPRGTTYRSDTALGFRLSSETRIDSLVLSSGTIYRYADGPDIFENDFTDPAFNLDYRRQGANSAASANLSYQSSEIAFQRLLTDILDDNGQLPPDFDPSDLDGTGRRIDLRASASLELGQQGPFGTTFTLGASESDYIDVTDPSLVDVSRRNAGVGLRFALTPTINATADLGYSEIDPDGPELFETANLNLGVDFQQQAGSLSFTVGYADTESGDELNLSVGRQITLPRGAISASLGAIRDPAGETEVSGSLTVQRTLKNASLNFSLDRSSRATDQGQRLVTAFTASYVRPLTQRTSLSLDAAYILSEDTAADTETDAANVGATVGYQLTQFWSLNLGYTYRTESSTGTPRADENSISVGIGRSFPIRLR